VGRRDFRSTRRCRGARRRSSPSGDTKRRPEFTSRPGGSMRSGSVLRRRASRWGSARPPPRRSCRTPRSIRRTIPRASSGTSNGSSPADRPTGRRTSRSYARACSARGS
jgi:hypothetical protein